MASLRALATRVARGPSTREAMRTYASRYVEDVTNCVRTGEGRVTEAGTFVFPMRWDFEGPMTGELEIEFEGDLAARMTWISSQEVD